MSRLKYKLGDVILLKKKSDLFLPFSDLPKTTKFTIVDVDDDEVPYLIEFIANGKVQDFWLMESEIKGLAKPYVIGGE